MVRPAVSPDWKLTMASALLNESGEAAERMELAAAKFDENPTTRGIANILRDRASDIRRAGRQTTGEESSRGAWER